MARYRRSLFFHLDLRPIGKVVNSGSRADKAFQQEIRSRDEFDFDCNTDVGIKGSFRCRFHLRSMSAESVTEDGLSASLEEQLMLSADDSLFA